MVTKLVTEKENSITIVSCILNPISHVMSLTDICRFLVNLSENGIYSFLNSSSSLFKISAPLQKQ